MEQIYFEAQVLAKKELDEIEEEVLKIMDLEDGQKEAQTPSTNETRILSQDVKIDEPQLAPDILEIEDYPPE